MRSVALIDAEYLAFALRGFQLRIDYAKLLSFLKARYAPLLRAVFYTGVDAASERQRRFFRAIEDIGYEICSRPFQKLGDKVVLKGLDIQLAADIMIWADSCDRIAVVSGDSDLAPCLAALPRKGVFGEVVAFRALLARRLQLAAANVTDLTEFIADLALERKGKADQLDLRPFPDQILLWQLKGLEPGRMKDMRAAVSGILLEWTLRALCQKHGIQVAAKDGLDALNNRLVQEGVYTKLIQKKIAVWGDIRNSATHGHFDQYTERDVEEFEKWLQDFLRSHHP